MNQLQERIAYLEEVYGFTLEALQSAGDLGNFQSCPGCYDSAETLTEETIRRARGLLGDLPMAVFLVDESTSDFFLAAASKPDHAAHLEHELERAVDNGDIFAALKRKKPLFTPLESGPFGGRRLLTHVISTLSRTRGLFLAVVPADINCIPDSSLHLLSILLLNAANTLESIELYRLLKQTNEGLQDKVRRLEESESALQSKQQDLEEQQSLFRQLFDNSPLAIALLDADGYVLLVNQGYQHLFGYAAEEVAGRRNSELIVPREAHGSVETTREVLLSGRCVQQETERVTSDGRRVTVTLVAMPVFRDGEVSKLFFTYQDISERKAYEDQLAYQAFHDALTKLPNRNLFMERLDRAVRRHSRHPEESYAVLVVDLDRFKHVNDSLGHLTGDKLLQEVGRRFTECVRDVDTVARMGGDEFAVLLEDISSPDEALHVARRFKEALQEPIRLGGQDVVCGASVGIVMNTLSYDTPDAVLRDADIAMYKAKRRGDGGYQIFDPAMYHKAKRTLKLENELRKAISRDELELHYQPIIDIKKGNISGFEALVRWRHPERGLLYPASFIHLAEETGLVIPLGEWVLETACTRAARWNRSRNGDEPLTVSVNLSNRQLNRKDIGVTVESALHRTGATPDSICLELTETAAMRDTAFSTKALGAFKDMGLHIAIDDFGTGYSSLSYLHSLPIDALKIDRSFLCRHTWEDNDPIVQAIITLGQSLGLTVVAEGVEDAFQAEQLSRMQCHRAQGFFYYRPMPEAAVSRLLPLPMQQPVPMPHRFATG